MVPPVYHSIKNSEIEEIEFYWGKLRLLAGEFEGRKGYMSKYLTSGDTIEIKATNEKAQVLFISSKRLAEPVVWGGPIVMNTKEELNKAFDDLKKGPAFKTELATAYPECRLVVTKETMTVEGMIKQIN